VHWGRVARASIAGRIGGEGGVGPPQSGKEAKGSQFAGKRGGDRATSNAR